MVTQAAALKKTIAALRLRPEHAALIAFCEGLAAAIDEDPSKSTLWREYRPAVELLMSLGEVVDDDGRAALLKLVRTPMGDSETG